jgi:LysM repeat protein
MATGEDLAKIALRNSTKQDLSGWCQYFIGLMISAFLGRPAPGGYISADAAREASNLEFDTPDEVPVGGILYFAYVPYGHVAVKVGHDLMIHASANKSGMITNYGRGVKLTRISQYNRRFLGGSRANGTRAAITGLKAMSLTPPPSEPSDLDVDAVAREVINGKWGNGADRVARLTAAGYDARIVQARVNQILATGGVTPPPPTKSVDELAREVIDGKWGNGADRVNRLTAAGFNAAQVQARVNQILAAAPKPAARTYTVQKGDNLSAIATKLKVAGGWRALYNANSKLIGGNPNLIRVGQVLTIP